MCNRFDFHTINTISDVSHNITTFIRLPVQFVLDIIEEVPQLRYFFEIDCSTGFGIISLIISLLFWFFSFVFLTVLFDRG
jgi:hypothetical protein